MARVGLRVSSNCMHVPVGLALVQANLDIVENSTSGLGLQGKKKVISVKSSCNFYFIDQK